MLKVGNYCGTKIQTADPSHEMLGRGKDRFDGGLIGSVHQAHLGRALQGSLASKRDEDNAPFQL